MPASLWVVLVSLLTLITLQGFAQGATFSVCASGCNATTISEAFGLASADGDSVSVASGLYDQEVACTINNTVNLNFSGAGVTVVFSGVWLTVAESGYLTITSNAPLVLQGAGITVVNGTLNQVAPLVFNNVDGPSAVILDSGVWIQTGLLVVNETSQVTDALIVLEGTDGTWNQYGNASFSISSRVPAVRFGALGQWFQRGFNFITHAPPTDTASVAAVDMSAGGLWLHMQDGPAEPHSFITVTGSEVYGVHMGADSVWGQYGKLSIQASQAATGVVLNSTNTWTTTSRSDFSLSGSTGVRFTGDSAKWTQQANVSFNAGSQAIGIEFSSGGTWRQFSSTSFAASGATGVSCGSSAGCCAQVVSPTLVKIFATLSAGARENDCAAAPSPSPLPSAVSLPISTASFGNNASSVALSGAVSANQSVSLELSLTNLQLGFTNLQGLNVTRTETNSTEGDTTAYTSQLDARTTLVQSYTFYRQTQQASFGGVNNFTVAAGTVKWSFNITVANGSDNQLSSAVAGAQQNGFTLSYRLSGLSNNNSNASTQQQGAGKIERKRNTPKQGMTTFAITLSGDAVAQVEVLNAAVVDGQVTTLGRIDLVWINNGSTGGGYYALELQFPPFQQSVLYDPSLGLGVLLGGQDGKGGGSTDLGLVVGVSVAIPVAVAVVVAVVVVALVVGWRRRKRWASATSSIDVDLVSEHEDEEQL